MPPNIPVLSLFCAALWCPHASAFSHGERPRVASGLSTVVSPKAKVSTESRRLAALALDAIRARYGTVLAPQAAFAGRAADMVQRHKNFVGGVMPASLARDGQAKAGGAETTAGAEGSTDLPWGDILKTVTDLGVNPQVVKGIADEVTDIAGQDSDIGRAAHSIAEVASRPENASNAPALVATPEGGKRGDDAWSNVLDTVAHLGGATSQVGKAVGNVADIVAQVAGKDTDVGKAFKQVADVSNTVSGVSKAVDGVARTGSSRDAKADNPFLKGLDAASNILGSIANVAGNVDGFVKTVADMTDGVDKARSLEGSSSKEHINTVLFGVIGSLAVAGGAGHLADRSFPAWSSAGRPRISLLTLLVGSYVCLVIGIFSVLFSFNLSVGIMGIHVNLTKNHWTHKSSCIIESMFSVIRLLFDTGSSLGATLVILYAMVIPAVKLALLLVGEAWRHSADERKVDIAGRCITSVQFVSKWACPDMFAYILLLYLLRNLDGKGGFLEAPAQLDVGFVCFSIFCVCSTVTCLAIQHPRKTNMVGTGAAVPESAVVRLCGREGVVFVAGTSFLVFGALLVIGCLTPCMGMRLNSSMLIQPLGPLPASLKPMIDSMHVDKLINADVNLWVCVKALWVWLCSKGEAACIIAVLMIVVFVLVVTIADMLMLCVAAWQLSSGEKGNVEAARGTMEVAHVLKHLSMLDVFAMGIVVVCAAGGAYRSQGVEFELMPGIAVLACAEAVHYATYFVVSGAVKAAAPEGDKMQSVE